MNIFLKLYIILLGNIYVLKSFADNGIIGEAGNSSAGIDGCPEMNLRTGAIHTCHIPQIIINMTNFFIGIAGTISIIFIIIGGYQLLFGGLENEKTKGKNTIVMALTGFAIASLSWFIIKLVFDNFS